MDHNESPKHQNRIAPVLAGGCFLLGFLLFWISTQAPYPSLWQSLMLVALVSGVCLLGRHAIVYVYRLEPDANGGQGQDVVVEQWRGRRRMVVCRLGVSDVREIELQTPENRKQLKDKYAASGDTVHSYCADVFVTSSAYLRFDDGGNRVVIRLQPSEQLLEVFRQALEENV